MKDLQLFFFFACVCVCVCVCVLFTVLVSKLQNENVPFQSKTIHNIGKRGLRMEGLHYSFWWSDLFSIGDYGTCTCDQRNYYISWHKNGQTGPDWLQHPPSPPPPPQNTHTHTQESVRIWKNIICRVYTGKNVRSALLCWRVHTQFFFRVNGH